MDISQPEYEPEEPLIPEIEFKILDLRDEDTQRQFLAYLAGGTPPIDPKLFGDETPS